jgi:hypothetical protein
MLCTGLLGLAILAMSFSACGNDAASVGHTSSVADASSAPANSSPLPAQRYIDGDYDNDDYDAAASGDADNDDSNRPKDRDNDADGGPAYYDRDDDSVRDFGKAAGRDDFRSIVSLIERYYVVAGAKDGAAACSMIDASLANSVPEDLGQEPGPSYLRGSTCAAVMTKVFELNRRQIASYEASGLKVTGVRIRGDRGLVVLGFRTLPGRQIAVSRENGSWKVDALLDSELP